MSDQADLSDMQHRLDDLEDRLHVEYPVPDTCGGAAQRVRIEVPAPRSLLTVGARGNATSEGSPLGPGGIALRTVESFGAEIKGRACIDTDGLTIFHAVDSARLLTQADLGIASSAALRVGTTEGNIEITAGEVPVNDPAFTVDPSMAVPDAPEVNTASPRRPTESQKTAVGAMFTAIDVASALRTFHSVFKNGLATGVAAGTVSAQVSGLLGLLRAAVTAGEVIWDGLLAAAEFVDSDHDYSPPSDPAVKVHGAGGIALTTPEKVSIFAGNAISLGSPHKISIAGGWKATLKSAGNAKLYGVLSTTVQSEGAVGIKGRVVSVSGDYAELKADQTIAVVSKGGALVQAKTKLAVNAPDTAIGATNLYLSARDELRCEADFIVADAKTQHNVWSGQKVSLNAPHVEIQTQGGMKLDIRERTATFDSGGATRLVIDPERCQVFGVRVERSRTRIRGNVDLG